MTIIEPSAPKAAILELLSKMHEFERKLWEAHGIRDDGGYAEQLVAVALDAKRNDNRVLRGSDLFHSELKRIEVRSRRKSFDKRDETRISVSDKRSHFEHCVHVLFNSDYTVRGGYIIPHDAIFRYIDSGNSKVRFEVGSRLPDSRDITPQLVAAQRRL